ncbi:DUF2806 domain-containing protein [Pseudovibrio brasiliensis]|uniref:DUF2806 domain-containing protein n=1 Tax=Pseudovibrio brasiliensis TaxID=1898042 RepID=A0ABX8AIR1_9HYPH|nr:DUF2806 domain-containing protein [Pseudovibrio brasiliensis]QUS54507.1 DUF2806 domain-containing protein [Pseudovibrio brasiliensis]
MENEIEIISDRENDDDTKIAETDLSTMPPKVEKSPQVHDIFGFGKVAQSPAAKSIVEGIGKLFDPVGQYMKIRAEGAALRYNTAADLALLKKFEAEGYDSSDLALVRDRFFSTELRRQANIESAVRLAIEQLDATQGSDTASEVDTDFFADWVEGVKDVSNQEVQKYWAKLLAATPKQDNGRLPKRLINFVKDIDEDVAREFSKLSELLRYTRCAFPTQLFSQLGKLGFEIDFRLLEEMGIVEVVNSVRSIDAGYFLMSQINSHPERQTFPTLSGVFLSMRAADLNEVLIEDEKKIDLDLDGNIFREFILSAASDKHLDLTLQPKDDSNQQIVCIAALHNPFGKRSHHFNDRFFSLDWAEVCKQLKGMFPSLPDNKMKVFEELFSAQRLVIRSFG